MPRSRKNPPPPKATGSLLRLYESRTPDTSPPPSPPNKATGSLLRLYESRTPDTSPPPSPPNKAALGYLIHPNDMRSPNYPPSPKAALDRRSKRSPPKTKKKTGGNRRKSIRRLS
jgi:hypothetical protein